MAKAVHERTQLDLQVDGVEIEWLAGVPCRRFGSRSAAARAGEVVRVREIHVSSTASPGRGRPSRSARSAWCGCARRHRPRGPTGSSTWCDYSLRRTVAKGRSRPALDRAGGDGKARVIRQTCGDRKAEASFLDLAVAAKPGEAQGSAQPSGAAEAVGTADTVDEAGAAGLAQPIELRGLDAELDLSSAAAWPTTWA